MIYFHNYQSKILIPLLPRGRILLLDKSSCHLQKKNAKFLLEILLNIHLLWLDFHLENTKSKHHFASLQRMNLLIYYYHFQTIHKYFLLKFLFRKYNGILFVRFYTMKAVLHLEPQETKIILTDDFHQRAIQVPIDVFFLWCKILLCISYHFHANVYFFPLIHCI